MSTEQNSSEQAKRRGRPPGSRKETSSHPPSLKRLKREKEHTPLTLTDKRSGDDQQLAPALGKPFPDGAEAASLGSNEVQRDIYRRVLELVASTAEDDARFWQISEAIFEYALLHLDPQREGLAITYAELMPPHEDGIHSLREVAMRGNYPWPTMLDCKAYLGSTTLACTSAMLQQIQTWDDLAHEARVQAFVDENEHSVCACPVMRAGRVAGVLIFASTQPSFFKNPITQQVIVEYTRLFALALCDTDFQSSMLFNFKPMPDLKWQRAELRQSYVNRIVMVARRYSISRQEAEQRVIRDMELEFERIARQSATLQQLQIEHY